MKLTDESIMPYGLHKGKQMKDIPQGWFIFHHDRGWLKGDVKDYAEENVPILRFVKEKRDNATGQNKAV